MSITDAAIEAAAEKAWMEYAWQRHTTEPFYREFFIAGYLAAAGHDVRDGTP